MSWLRYNQYLWKQYSDDWMSENLLGASLVLLGELESFWVEETNLIILTVHDFPFTLKTAVQ